MNYSGLIPADFANGIGVRVTLFVSGCDLRCEGCHSPDLQSFENGAVFDSAAESQLLSYLGKPWVSGITISGGHPLAERNRTAVRELLLKIREQFPNKNVWLYTGYELTEKDFSPKTGELYSALTLCDVVVDGPFVESLRNITLAFRGSSNQRIIDVRRTIETGEIATLDYDN